MRSLHLAFVCLGVVAATPAWALTISGLRLPDTPPDPARLHGPGDLDAIFGAGPLLAGLDHTHATGDAALGWDHFCSSR